MADHALFSPSKMSMILLCPASAQMEKAMQEQGKVPPPSEYAAHGTKLHDYVHFSLVNDTEENLKDLSVEDRGYCLACINYLKVLIKSLGHSNYTIVYEYKVSLAQWGLSEVWGTVDVALLDNVTQHLLVIDWKFGSGVYVSAYMNAQALTYAAGAIKQPTRLKKITCHIVQPPIDNYSHFKISYTNLHRWVHGTLAIAIEDAKDLDNLIYNPGVEQCRWCAGKNHCKARFQFVKETAGKVFKYYEMTNSIPKEEMLELIEFGPMVEKAIKQYKAFVTEEMQRGRDYPGLKLVRGRAYRKWKDEQTTINYLIDKVQLDPEDLFKAKLLSPAQAEKLDSKLKKDEKFQALFVQPPGKPTLVKDSDPRTAIEPEKKAIDIFKDYAVSEKDENKL